MDLSLRKLSKKLYRSSKTYKSLRWIIAFRPFLFTLRFLNGLFILDKLDVINPYKGIISKNLGFYVSTVSSNCVKTFNNMYHKENKLQRITINESNIESFNEVFSLIERPIIDYLGSKVKLDGIAYLICKENRKSNFYFHEFY